jgi:glycosyltransferase involved in cell wall biosynthesis
MFSVIIPVYNHARFLREAVASALASDLVKEVLLCDDGSKDGSAALCSELASEYPVQVRDFSEQPSRNRGAHNRLNQLCRLATQPWLRVLNSDDFFLPGSFETLRLLAATQRATCISGSMLICDEHGKMLGTKRGVFDPEFPLPRAIEAKSVYKNDEVRKLLLNQNFIATTSNMAFTRELFEKIGGFADFRYAHDLDFALRATMHGNAIHSSAFVVTYRIHGANTISEVSPHMDGEITRLYARFLHDFPEVEENKESHYFLQHNTHIEPFPSDPAKIFKNTPQRLVAEYHLAPSLPDYALPNSLLALGCLNYDFVITSHSLVEAPEVESGGLNESFASVGPACRIAAGMGINEVRGRVMRCPQKESRAEKVQPLASLLPCIALRIEGADILVGKPSPVRREIRPQILDLLKNKLASNPNDKRPVIFVLPIFLAVGGVERNTIEVIRLLKEEFRFVVITTERLSPAQGSLHWQLYDMEIPVFDLAEVANQEHHIHLMSAIAEILSPQLLWICNGSPWLIDNAIQIRRLFANIPIIDQEVYDTQEGWIAHYHTKGIQSFDSFIAINSKIYNAFQKRFLIPAHRVSLIYPMLADEKVRQACLKVKDRAHLRNEMGVPNHFNKVFIFVGRLTDQKKPMTFLNLVQFAKHEIKDCFFLMVGDGELGPKCDDFISNEGLNNIMRIPYHPCPPDLMALADGMIITSIYEGLPIAMLEALGIGIPVLATDVGDIRLVLEKYGSGLVFDIIDLISDTKKACSQMRNFLKQLDFYKVAAVKNSNAICTEFGMECISKKYHELFSRQLKSGHYGDDQNKVKHSKE